MFERLILLFNIVIQLNLIRIRPNIRLFRPFHRLCRIATFFENREWIHKPQFLTEFRILRVSEKLNWPLLPMLFRIVHVHCNFEVFRDFHRKIHIRADDFYVFLCRLNVVKSVKELARKPDRSKSVSIPFIGILVLLGVSENKSFVFLKTASHSGSYLNSYGA